MIFFEVRLGKCLNIIFVLLLTASFSFQHDEDEPEGTFICRKCGETVASAKDVVSIHSTLSLNRWNKTISDKKLAISQLFKNPQGSKFEVVTFTEANLKSAEDAHTEASWFPGYAWRISVCPRCRYHIGWKFQPEKYNHMTYTETDTFYGLILDHMVKEAASDSIILDVHKYR